MYTGRCGINTRVRWHSHLCAYSPRNMWKNTKMTSVILSKLQIKHTSTRKQQNGYNVQCLKDQVRQQKIRTRLQRVNIKKIAVKKPGLPACFINLSYSSGSLAKQLHGCCSAAILNAYWQHHQRSCLEMAVTLFAKESHNKIPIFFGKETTKLAIKVCIFEVWLKNLILSIEILLIVLKSYLRLKMLMVENRRN